MTTNTPFLTPAELEQLQRQTLQLRAQLRRPVNSRYAGAALSRYRGHGMELEDLRPYQPGDDVRHIDWRSTARTARAMTKVFREERQRAVYLVVDRSPTMAFGTRREIKAATAARAAAILCFSALAQHERVAGWIMNPGNIKTFTPCRTLEGALQLIGAAMAPLAVSHDTALTLDDTLAGLNRVVESGGAIYLISDFYALTEGQRTSLRQLAERCDVTALHVIDPAEEQLPAAGTLRLFSAAGHSNVIDTDIPRLRERYAELMAQRHAEISRTLHEAGVTVHPLYTDRDTLPQLGKAMAGASS